MISALEPTSGKATPPVCQLKITLLGSKPLIWRQLHVPAKARLDWLHAVLQVAIGWTNSHLHQFWIGGEPYSDTRHNFAEFEGDTEIHEARKFTLQQVAPNPGDTFGYEYDFGDSWEHEVTVEKILPADPADATTALCLDGARAGPPEDCGGIWGYAELLKTLKNKKHPDHQQMKEWIGGKFDAAAFDVKKTNRWLAKLKWPGVTDAQLRKVLMGRDDYRG